MLPERQRKALGLENVDLPQKGAGWILCTLVKGCHPAGLKKGRQLGTLSRVTILEQPLPSGRVWNRVTEKGMESRPLRDKGIGIHLQVLTLVVQRLTA